jgi:hypothetical protein
LTKRTDGIVATITAIGCAMASQEAVSHAPMILWVRASPLQLGERGLEW